ncbi:oligosaccharyl transferase subunit ost3/OST6 [Blastocladiella emersonii ATCC 22665]|nr:oligosaccharyl transferase subunit ost3/OST6 [Blastocladiella emersonii ATCC 22665]
MNQRAFLLWAAVAVLALLGLLFPSAAHGYTAAYKAKKLASLHRESNVLTLDSTAFNVLVDAPRNYSVVVLLTAMDPQVGCAACHQFDPEFRAAAMSWQWAKGQHPLYFASLDFVGGRDVYAKLGLNSAPNVYFYPATEGPFALPAPEDKGEFVDYQLARRGIAGEALVEWLSTQVNEKFTFQLPPDYTKHVAAAFGVLVLALTYRYVLLAVQLVFTNRKLYALGSLVAILLFNAGTMWNSIRQPPFVVQGRNGQTEYISQGMQQQHGIETQISALLHGTCAFAVVALIVAVPKVHSALLQRALVVALLTVLVGCYSVVMRVFNVKSPGYPFQLLPL